MDGIKHQTLVVYCCYTHMNITGWFRILTARLQYQLQCIQYLPLMDDHDHSIPWSWWRRADSGAGAAIGFHQGLRNSSSAVRSSGSVPAAGIVPSCPLLLISRHNFRSKFIKNYMPLSALSLSFHRYSLWGLKSFNTSKAADRAAGPTSHFLWLYTGCTSEWESGSSLPCRTSMSRQLSQSHQHLKNLKRIERIHGKYNIQRQFADFNCCDTHAFNHCQ